MDSWNDILFEQMILSPLFPNTDNKQIMINMLADANLMNTYT